MTELLTRTHAAASRVGDRAADSSVWVRGALAALWAVAMGVAALVVLVLIVWAADSRSGSSAGAAIRMALQGWLLAHRVPMHVPGGTVAVAPLGLTLLLGLLVARSAAVVARGHHVDDLGGVATTAAAVGIPYGVLATFVAAAANSTPVRPQPVAALAAGTLLGCVAAAWGAVRGAGLAREAWRALPSWLRGPVAAGGAAVGVLVACALLMELASLALHLSAVTDLAGGLGGGPVGLVGLAALDVALLPNAVACGLGYLAGPGFAVGAGTSYGLAGAHPGPLPALPLLGALPHGAAPLVVQLVGVAVVVGAGGVAGWLVQRDAGAVRRGMAMAGAAAAAAGLVAAAFVALAGGPAGPGRMAAVGASPWQTGLAVTGEVGIVACAVAGVALLWRARTD